MGRSIISVGRPGGKYASKKAKRQAREASRRPSLGTVLMGLTAEQRKANYEAAERRAP